MRSTEILQGWKEIAEYVSRDERTAKRWEKERGLPVRRTPGRGRGSVYALVADLDSWLGRMPVTPDAAETDAREEIRQAPRWRRVIPAVAAVAVVALAGAALMVSQHKDRVSAASRPVSKGCICMRSARRTRWRGRSGSWGRQWAATPGMRRRGRHWR